MDIQFICIFLHNVAQYTHYNNFLQVNDHEQVNIKSMTTVTAIMKQLKTTKLFQDFK